MNDEELKYAEYTQSVIDKNTAEELAIVSKLRTTIVDERKYYMDYLAELKEDEKQDLLGFEETDTKNYISALNHLARLAKQKKEPYFGGFKFKNSKTGSVIDAHISLQMLKDSESDKVVTIDWRAPIASLYYNVLPGEASFDAPVGTVSGELFEKKRFFFKNGKLKKVINVNLPSDDEMLSDILSQNAGVHMKSIVSTLQEEQYRIIRERIDGTTIVSGCAGSGKTSIALHKAAFVIYNMKEELVNSSILVVSPNSFFSEYISDVLPELGEDRIETVLPENILESCISESESYEFMSLTDEADAVLSGNRKISESRRLKNTTHFKKIVEKYIEYLRLNIFKADDFYISEELEEIVRGDILNELFYEKYNDLPLYDRAQELANEVYRMKAVKEPDAKAYVLDCIKKMYKSQTACGLYELMFMDEDFKHVIGEDLTAYGEVKDSFEDACAIALIGHDIFERYSSKSVFYLICDEAQDYSPIFLTVLARYYNNSHMMFVGDSDQMIYEGSGTFAENIVENIHKPPYYKYNLTTNYRSTTEIVDYASALLGHKPGDFSSVRSGKPVEHISKADILDVVKNLRKDGYGSVAILTETQDEASEIDANINSFKSICDDMRILVLPVYLAKGLEFDAAIVCPGKTDYYTQGAGKYLYYTACTRAMHELYICDKD